MRTRRTRRRSSSHRRSASIPIAIALAPLPAQAAGALELIPEIPLLVTLLVLFIVLIFPVNALIIKPIFSALDARENRIEGARNRARQIQTAANDVLQRYEDSIQRARIEADATRKQQIAEARSEHAAITAATRRTAEEKLEQARAELSGSLAEARSGLRTSSRALAVAAAEQILGRSLS